MANRLHRIAEEHCPDPRVPGLEHPEDAGVYHRVGHAGAAAWLLYRNGLKPARHAVPVIDHAVVAILHRVDEWAFKDPLGDILAVDVDVIPVKNLWRGSVPSLFSNGGIGMAWPSTNPKKQIPEVQLRVRLQVPDQCELLPSHTERWRRYTALATQYMSSVQLSICEGLLPRVVGFDTLQNSDILQTHRSERCSQSKCPGRQSLHGVSQKTPSRHTPEQMLLPGLQLLQ
jgi:hypothetical protein